MTNRKWLRGMSNEEMAKLISNHNSCYFCLYKGGKCIDDTQLLLCENGICEWLNSEHGNPMPEIRVGDVLQFKIGDSNKIYTATVIREDWMFSLDIDCGLARISDSYYKVVELWRFNGERLDTIWRTNDE